jgi:hypothetical protein
MVFVRNLYIVKVISMDIKLIRLSLRKVTNINRISKIY